MSPTRETMLLNGQLTVTWVRSQVSKLRVHVLYMAEGTTEGLNLFFTRREAEALIALTYPRGPQPPGIYLLAGWDADALQRLHRRRMIKLKEPLKGPVVPLSVWMDLAAHPEKWELTQGAERVATHLRDNLLASDPWSGLLPLFALNDDSDKPWSPAAIAKLQAELASFGLHGEVINNVEAKPRADRVGLAGPHVKVGFQRGTYWLRWMPSVEERIGDCIMTALPLA